MQYLSCPFLSCIIGVRHCSLVLPKALEANLDGYILAASLSLTFISMPLRARRKKNNWRTKGSSGTGWWLGLMEIKQEYMGINLWWLSSCEQPMGCALGGWEAISKATQESYPGSWLGWSLPNGSTIFPPFFTTIFPFSLILSASLSGSYLIMNTLTSRENKMGIRYPPTK